tara:strand:+ start:781 stop:1059 length:279 start_codon:yes stop_codon:yes gene_type:complete
LGGNDVGHYDQRGRNAAHATTGHKPGTESIRKLSQLTMFKRGGGKLVPTEHGLMQFDEIQRSYLGLERIGNAIEALCHFHYGQIAAACLPAF